MLYNCHYKIPIAVIQRPRQKIIILEGGKMTNGDILILYAMWFVLAFGLAIFLFKKST
ncbi:MAG: hypothetical protein AB7K73_00900 [Gammaproteobacteria bacterium]